MKLNALKLAVALLFLPSILNAYQLSGNNISSASFNANTNKSFGTVVDDTSPDHKTCAFVNSPVWINISGVNAIKFDNINARIDCTEADMPYGDRPYTFMTMFWESSATVTSGQFFVMGSGGSGGSRYTTRVGGGGGNGTLYWAGGGQDNFFNTLQFQSKTWQVVGCVYPGGALPQTCYLVYKSTYIAEVSAFSTAFNQTVGFHQWGDWTTAGDNCKCSLANMTIINRALSKEEFVSRARQMLGKGIINYP